MANDRGFTLLEVIVAFIIAALALGALARGAAGGLQSTDAAAHYQDALSRARSRLALANLNLQPGDQTGDDGGGYTWHVHTEPIATTPRPEDGPPAKRATLYAVTVTIAWRLDGTARNVVLTTRRLAEAAPEPP